MLDFVRKHFKELNIKPGDKIVVYPKISSFGIAKKKFVSELLDTIIKYIGLDGTIIMPSYTFEKNKKFIFNPKILKKNYSTSPLVQEFFKIKEIKRSIRPIHSHIGIGKEIGFLNNKNNFDSFGNFSDFNFFLKNNFKSIFLGSSPNDSATYLINLEYLMNVSYRKKIKIIKKINLNNKIYSAKINYFDKPKNIIFDYDRAFSEMIKSGFKVKKSKLKFGYSLSFFYKDLHFYGKKLFKKNEYCLLKKDSNNEKFFK